VYLHFPICILQVHAGVVEEFAHRMNTFDKVPDAVVVSLLHHKAREIAADADAYTKLLCAWPVTQAEAGGEVPVAPAVLKLSDPLCRSRWLTDSRFLSGLSMRGLST